LLSDVESAVSIAKQIGVNKYNDLKTKVRRYRRGGDLHSWFTDKPDFELWLKRVRAGPTACVGVDFGQQNKRYRPSSTSSPYYWYLEGTPCGMFTDHQEHADLIATHSIA
jgi:hypothetical protein